MVTCTLTVKSRISSIYLGGHEIAATGDYNDWTVAKIITFTDVDAVFAVAGMSDEEGGNGCSGSGLSMQCTATNASSPWNGYRSQIDTWNAYGSNDATLSYPAGWLEGSAGSVPCVSTASFALPGYTHLNVDKIWPSNGGKYAWFSTNPYGTM